MTAKRTLPRTAALLLLLLAVPALSAAPEAESREFKFALKAQAFADPASGMAKAWDAAKEVAAELGLKVKEEPFEPEAERFVAFLDTKDFAVRKAGHLLRVRRTKEFGAKALPGRSGELTLKFRSTDPRVAAAAAVSPAPGLDGEAAFEEDAILGPASIRRVYSKSAKIETDDLPPCTVAGFSALFPAFAKLGIPAGTPLGLVRGVAVRELRVKPGKIDFGGGKGKVTLTVWLDAATSRTLLGEFSFSMAAGQEVASLEAARTAERFAKALAKRFGPALETGATKTGIVYGDEADTDE